MSTRVPSLIVSISWGICGLFSFAGAAAAVDDDIEAPTDGWVIRIEDQGHEPNHYRTQVRSDGSVRVLNDEKGDGHWKTLHAGRAADAENLAKVYEAAKTLVEGYRLTAHARPGAGRDDDSAYRVSVATDRRSIS